MLRRNEAIFLFALFLIFIFAVLFFLSIIELAASILQKFKEYSHYGGVNEEVATVERNYAESPETPFVLSTPIDAFQKEPLFKIKDVNCLERSIQIQLVSKREFEGEISTSISNLDTNVYIIDIDKRKVKWTTNTTSKSFSILKPIDAGRLNISVCAYDERFCAYIQCEKPASFEIIDIERDFNSSTLKFKIKALKNLKGELKAIPYTIASTYGYYFQLGEPVSFTTTQVDLKKSDIEEFKVSVPRYKLSWILYLRVCIDNSCTGKFIKSSLKFKIVSSEDMEKDINECLKSTDVVLKQYQCIAHQMYSHRNDAESLSKICSMLKELAKNNKTILKRQIEFSMLTKCYALLGFASGEGFSICSKLSDLNNEKALKECYWNYGREFAEKEECIYAASSAKLKSILSECLSIPTYSAKIVCLELLETKCVLGNKQFSEDYLRENAISLCDTMRSVVESNAYEITKNKQYSYLFWVSNCYANVALFFDKNMTLCKTLPNDIKVGIFRGFGKECKAYYAAGFPRVKSSILLKDLNIAEKAMDCELEFSEPELRAKCLRSLAAQYISYTNLANFCKNLSFEQKNNLFAICRKYKELLMENKDVNWVNYNMFYFVPYCFSRVGFCMGKSEEICNELSDEEFHFGVLTKLNLREKCIEEFENLEQQS